MEKDGRVTVIAVEYQGKRLNDPSDVVVRRDGQVYFSDPAPKDSLQHFELGYAGVYHVTPGGQISLIAKMPRPNGVTLTPDGRTLYVADTSERKIMAYDLDAEGNATLMTGLCGLQERVRRPVFRFGRRAFRIHFLHVDIGELLHQVDARARALYLAADTTGNAEPLVAGPAEILDRAIDFTV